MQKKKKKMATSSSHFLVHPHLQCDFFFSPSSEVMESFPLPFEPGLYYVT